MTCWRGCVLVMLVGMISAIGCDKAPTPPRAAERPPAEPAPAAPTTQELMSGTYKKVPLSPLPFSASVPQSWETKIPEGTTITVLHGPGIDGLDIQMTLEVGNFARGVAGQSPTETLESILARAKKAAEKDKTNVRLFDIKTVGDIKVMEEQRLFTGAGSPQQLIDWKITYFVHRDLNYAPNVINILGLTTDRFEQNKDLLRKIIDSIQYDPSLP